MTLFYLPTYDELKLIDKSVAEMFVSSLDRKYLKKQGRL